jgi:hypothetical protein
MPTLGEASATRKWRPAGHCARPVAVYLVALALGSSLLSVGSNAEQSGRSSRPVSLSHIALASSLSSWTAQIDASTLAAVACTDVLHCLVVGGTSPTGGIVYETTNGGDSWSTSSVPSGTSSLLGVSCVSGAPSECFAAGGTSVIQSSKGGSTWSADTLPTVAGAPIPGIGGISCPSTSTCVAAAAGEMIYTTNGGSTWSDTSVGTSTVGGISCASTTTCVEVGTTSSGRDGQIFVANGSLTSWTSSSGPGGSPLYGVSCASTSDCAAVGITLGTGPLAIYTTDGGSTWTTASGTPGSTLTSVSCLASTCFAVGTGANISLQVGYQDYVTVSDVLAVSTDDGHSWSLNSKPPSNDRQGLSGVSCGSAFMCVAVGPRSILETEDGTNWTSDVAPQPGLSSISCPTKLVCYANERFNGATLDKTINGGASWVSTTTPFGGFVQIDCPSASDCVGVGDVNSGSGVWSIVASTTDGGITWTIDANDYTYGDFVAVSCASVSSCAAVGYTSSSDPVFAAGAIGAAWDSPSLPSLTDPTLRRWPALRRRPASWRPRAAPLRP